MGLYDSALNFGISKEQIKKIGLIVATILVIIILAYLISTIAVVKPLSLQLNPPSLKMGKGNSTLKVIITNTFENERVATLIVRAADETSLQINPIDNPTVKLAKGETREFYYEVIPSETILPGRYLITAELQLGEKTFVENIYLTLKK